MTLLFWLLVGGGIILFSGWLLWAFFSHQSFGTPIGERAASDIIRPEILIRKEYPGNVGGQMQSYWFDTILAALKENPNVKRVTRGARTEVVATPYTHIFLQGLADIGDGLSTPLEQQLSGTLSENITENFRVQSVITPGGADKICAYFGVGVYCPLSDQMPVATLEFGAAPAFRKGMPAPGTVAPADRFQPVLRQQVDHIAAFYQDQKSCTVGFDDLVCPVCVPAGSLKYDVESERFLRNLVLFFGREHSTAPAIVQARKFDAATSKYVRLAASLADEDKLGNWYSGGPEWRRLTIDDPGAAKVDVFFRYMPRCGVARFHPHLVDPAKTEAQGYPILEISGILLPKIPAGVKRWWVSFDRDGLLCHLEQMVAENYLVCAGGEKTNLFNHRNGWAGTVHSVRGNVLFPIFQESNLEVRDLLPEDLLRGNSDSAEVNKMTEDAMYHFYSIEPFLLNFENEQPFGQIILPHKPADSTKQIQVLSQPADSIVLEPANGNILSLDWLNRAAAVEHGKTRGLAEYWCQSWDIKMVPKADGLQVFLYDAKENRNYDYFIPVGESGPLGPLILRYKIGGTGESDQ